jgi:hypothetical protein
MRILQTGLTLFGGVVLLLCAWLPACSASGGSGSGGTPGAGGGAAASAGGSAAGGSSSIDASGGSSGQGATECPNVDILFVIDNSGSMGDNQVSLINSFAGFVDGMREKLSSTQSFHVGVVVPDDYGQNAGCGTIGDLVTQTWGPESSNQTCSPFTSGSRFLDQNEPDLAAKFACVGKVGAGGSSDERPMRALLNAIDPANNVAGACNAGFSRLDSLLVVVIITDEDDVPDNCDGAGNCETQGSGGTPDEWSSTLIGYKGGYEQNIVVLSLIGRKLDNPCGAVPASKILGFTNNFQNGSIGDICAPSYDDFFRDALPLIDEACVNFVPPR